MADAVTAISADTERKLARREEVPLHPNRCGPCEDCAEFLAEAAAPDGGEGEYWAQTLGHPNREQLARHAERFGEEGMEPWGVAVPKSRSRAGKRRVVTRAEIRALAERGRSVEEIAAALDVPKARVQAALENASV